MRIGFISDTHGGYDDTVKALELLGKCDYIIHLGDVLYHGPRNAIPATYDAKKLAELFKGMEKIYFVRGNCDSDVDETVTCQDLKNRSRLLDLGGVKVFAVHGYEEDLDTRIKIAKELHADILAFGHTHIKVLEKSDGMFILNPGSTTIPKDGSKSCAVYENGEIKFIEFK